MADLLITKTGAGTVLVTPTDPFSRLEVHRIDRASWRETPAVPGVYLLYGFIEGEPAVYIGMSTTSMRDRVQQHHVAPRKNWFGVLFAVPIQGVPHCQPIEAEMIRRVTEAGVVGIVDNRAVEERWLDAEDVHVAPALTAITGALELLLGSDIFSPQDDEGSSTVDILPERTPLLARVYRGAASQSRVRREGDPVNATHSYVGSGMKAVGRFVGDEPDTRFEVFAGAEFRRPTLDESQAAYLHQKRADRLQQELVTDGVLDLEQLVFLKDHIFENWSRATVVVSGKGSYSGAYHWQQIRDA